ncbi:MAG: DUF6525 family protein [Paracoccaceae bacterium]
MKATNRGETGLTLKQRPQDPMQIFDTLPAPVRIWLSKAVLPWSPASCRRIIWRAKARGECLDDILERLARAQEKTLLRHAKAPRAPKAPQPICVALTSKPSTTEIEKDL